MKKKPSLSMQKKWQGILVVALVALLLVVSYLGRPEAQTASVTLPVKRLQVTPTPGASGEAAAAPAVTPTAAVTSTPTAAPVAAKEGAVEGFDAYRQRLTAARASAAQLLDEVIDNAAADANLVQAALQQKEALAQSTQTEAAIEALLAARGLPEALCTVREGSVNVVVKTNQLTQQQAAQILDIVMAESGEAAANVKIIPAL